jgi:hypothetical protein
MASIFVSHSSSDRHATERVSAYLRAAGYAALFVDFDPEQGIPAGRDWKRELYGQLRRADAVVFLASAASAASHWCALEVGLAQSLGTPVFPVRLQPGLRMPLLDDVQWVNNADGEAGLDRLLHGLRAAGLDPDDSYSWDPLRSPYPGLAPFAFEDAAVFFGRERETARLVELLQPTLQRGAGRFVGIVGPSGSGKSSLLRAGLLPRLRRSPGRWVLLSPLQPGRHPTRDLAGCLARAFAENGAPRSTADLASILDEGSAGLQKVAEELSEMAGGGGGRPNVLVVLDQAEELLTRTGPVEQHAFLDLVTGALAEDSPLWVVATVRSEFLSSAPDRAGLADAIDDTVVIEPLGQARLAEVIARPARRAGLEFAPGLIERMVQDTAGGDALPLLAHTLRELCEQAGPDGRIGIADYDAVGGVLGALRNRADRVTEELGRRGHGELVVPTLVRLATVTGQDEPTRRRVRRSTLSPDEQAVVDAFIEARLLTSDHAPAAATDGAPGDATVEVAHEALLRQWPPLREAIEADRNGLRLRSELERLAADWERANRDDAYLLRGARLAVFEEWAGTHPGSIASLDTARNQDTERSRDVSALQAEFVRRSSARQRREVRSWRIVAAVLAVLVLTAGTLTFVTVHNAVQITAQLATANADAIARESGARLGRDPLLATELALVAWRSDPHSARARSALADAYVALAGTDSVVYTQPDRRPVGQVLTDGELLRTLSLPSGISATAGVLGPAPVTLNLPHGVTSDASPDGSRLAVVAENGALRLHDIDGSEPPIDLAGASDAVRSARFSPDGNRVTWISGESLRVHEIRSRTTTTAPHALPAGTEIVQLTIDPDVAIVQTAGGIAVHSLTTGAEVRALSAGTTIAADGRYTVTCVSDDSTNTVETDELIVRDTASDTELRRIPLRTGCSAVRYTQSNRHALESLDFLSENADSPAEANRIIDLATGATYQFVGPDIDRATWELNDDAPVISALPTPDGGLDVFVAVGPSVLRIPARREPPGLHANLFDTTFAPGGLLEIQASARGTSRFTLRHTTTEMQIAERTTGASTGWLVDDGLWVLSYDDTNTYVQRYAFPDLSQTLQLGVPRRPDSQRANAGIATDRTTEILVIATDNTLTAFDTRTERPLGNPVPVPAMLDPQLMWVRTDHPGEAIIAGREALELWDVPSGRRLGSGSLTVRRHRGVVTRGDTLVALTAEGDIEVRALPDMERVGAPIAAPELQALLGFDAEGRLVAATDGYGAGQMISLGDGVIPNSTEPKTTAIVFWDLDRRAESGRMRANGGAPRSVHGGPVIVGGSSGLLPEALDVRADVWHEHLCRLLPRELSDAAIGLLPAGTDRSSPCP